MDNLRAGESFSHKLDESVDINRPVQLIAFARYVETSDICEHILFLQNSGVERNWTGYFQLVSSFFSEHGVHWKSCTSVRSDAASIMTRMKGLMAHIREENPEVLWTHCNIHREALASKMMSQELNSVFE